MILGVGIDVVSKQRIDDLCSIFPERFAQRILTPQEICKAPTDRSLLIKYIAKRFAAKEAIAKALRCGIGQVFSFQSVSITNDSLGAPEVIFLQDYKHLIDGCIVHVSLSDEREYACAVAIIEQVKA